MKESLFLGIAIGLPGSLHCLGMCGPLALMVGAGKKNVLFSSILYHVSRSLSYTLLGLLAGLMFQWVDVRPYQQQLSLLIGLLFLIAWLLPWIGKFKFTWGGILLEFLKKLPQLLSKDRAGSMVAAGIINGLLPCGLVYSALLAALSSGDTLSSGLFMFGFGMATLPMMLLVTWVSGSLTAKISNFFMVVSKGWLLIMAAIFILRGAGLGIPYISPKFESANPSQNCCRPR